MFTVSIRACSAALITAAIGMISFGPHTNNGGTGSATSETTTTAIVETLERSCGYTQTDTLTRNGAMLDRKTYHIDLECKDDPAFIAIRNGKSDTWLTGHATAFVKYVSPKDKQTHMAKITIEANRQEFYAIEIGQKIQINLDPDYPNTAYI